MRSHPAPDRPAFEQLFSTLRITIISSRLSTCIFAASSATQPSHQASALAPTMDHGGHRDVSHARKPQITSLLTDWLPYWTWARCPRHSIEAGGHCRDVGPDEFELLDLADGHLDRATPSGPARPSGEWAQRQPASVLGQQADVIAALGRRRPERDVDPGRRTLIGED